MFKFVLRSTVEGARAGVLSLPRKGARGGSVEISTPAVLLCTRKGSPLHISPDILQTLRPGGTPLLQISSLHFLESPDPSVVASAGGLHEFLAMQENALFMLARDPMLYEVSPNSNNAKHATFDTAGGRRQVSPARHMEIVQALQPDVYVALADEVPAWATAKRVAISVDRTLQWLDECLALCPEQKSVFAVVVGARISEERKRCAQEAAKRQVAGFHVGGFGAGESPEDRPALLQAAVECLPPEKPRHVSGLGMPEEVLHAISDGIDLFDSTYAHHLTAGGYAMTFPLQHTTASPSSLSSATRTSPQGGAATVPNAPPQTGVADGMSCKPRGSTERLVDGPGGAAALPERDAQVGKDHAKINLRAIEYRLDGAPLVAGCGCYTCTRHTRSYINHLLNTHEMLAEVLLDIHNVYHYLGFFEEIRRAISQGRFEEYKTLFIQRRRAYT